MSYDYREAIRDDIKEWVKENIDYLDYKDQDREDFEQKLYDDLWIEDSVTGNGSGSYTFNSYEAEENICHNLDLLGEALTEFGDDPNYLLKQGAEACDVTIRCYLLSECISEVLNELEKENFFDKYREEQEVAVTVPFE